MDVSYKAASVWNCIKDEIHREKIPFDEVNTKNLPL